LRKEKKREEREKKYKNKNCDLFNCEFIGSYISTKMPDTEIELIDKNNLISELRSCNPNKKEIIILDCRSANDYAVSHIKHSANISIPTIMLRRLKEGT
jgi:hypothetical protein